MFKMVSAQDVFERILNHNPLFILDVRNEDAYADWKIEGSSVTSVNVPYFDLLDGLEPLNNKIPEDKNSPVLVVCAKEGSSEYVGEELVNSGRENVTVLEGGMKAWSEYLHPIKVGDLSSGGAIYQFLRPGKGCLSYLIASDGEAAVVDTARMTDVYIEFAKSNALEIKHVLDTHLHADHVSGGRTLAKATGATYWLPPKDAPDAEFSYQALEGGQVISVGNTKVEINAVYSPGHTIGSTSFIVDNKYLLSGDILFVKSIGRPDLAGKAEDWVSDLRNSLYHTFKNLPKDLVLLPAHYSDNSEMNEAGCVCSTLGDLYKQNDGLLVDDESVFRELVTKNLPPQPNSYQEIRLTNMGKMTPDEAAQREMEIGPNRCAVHG